MEITILLFTFDKTKNRENMSEHLRKWIADYDNGNVMESVEMGGMGYGYEQAIQECAIETMRNLQMVKMPKKDKTFSNALSVASDSAVDLLKAYGYSGAQVGAARNIAAVYWKQTPAKGIALMRDIDPNRIIKIQKSEDGSVRILNYPVQS